MPNITLTGWTNKFLQKLNTLSTQDKIDARTLIDAASHTDTAVSLAAKQPLDSDLTDYATAADAAARRILIGAASTTNPAFNNPTALTATVGDRSSLLATTEFVWGNGPLKAIPADGANAGSLLAQYNNTVAANTLGYGSVDLQGLRSSGSQTATGAYSFVAGGGANTASGYYSHAEGSGNTASGAASHAEGTNNIASGHYSHVQGAYNTASGYYSHAEGGINTASGLYSHAEGSGNTASGAASHAEGTNNIASGRSSHVGGQNSTASLQGQVTYGAASLNSQHSRLDLYKETTDATPAILAIDSASALLTIRTGWSMAGTVNILGIKTTDGTVAAHYIRKFAIKNVAGTTSLSGTVTALGTDYESDAGLDVSVTANNTDDSIDITVTGLAATTIRWAAVVDAIEVKLT
jgi:hypothetical protein